MILMVIIIFVGYNADIICLQEVDDRLFENDFLPVMSQIGFDGELHTKGDTREGVACFYNKTKFKYVLYE